MAIHDKLTVSDFSRPWFKKKLFLSKKPYFLEKSREEGESELEALAAASKREGSWIFLHQPSVWLNMTCGHSVSKSSHSVEYRVQHREADLSQFGSRMTHYHIHPNGALRDVLRSIKKQVESTRFDLHRGDKPQPHQFEIRSYLGSILGLPSKADVKAYLDLIFGNPGVVLDFVVITPLGYTYVVVDPSGIGSGQNQCTTDTLCRQYGELIDSFPGFFDYYDFGQKAKERIDRYDKVITEKLGACLKVINITRTVLEAMASSGDTFPGGKSDPKAYANGSYLRHATAVAVDALIPIFGQHDAIRLANRSIELWQRESKQIFK